ncbi:MAG: hypothetical protein AAGA66_15705 [Bacteroidota bacterium]
MRFLIELRFLGNHFHFLIRVRSEKELRQLVPKTNEKPLYWHVSNGFSSLFQSYTRAMNKMYSRTGPLFESPFKRKKVIDDAYFSRLVIYIHQNPQKHGLVKDFRDYPHSSFHSFLTEKSSTRLKRKEVLDWFGGKEGFEKAHRLEASNLSEEWLLEDH